MDDDVVLGEVAVNETGIVESADVLPDHLVGGVGVLDVDLAESLPAALFCAEILHHEHVALDSSGVGDTHAGQTRPPEVGELLSHPRDDDRLLVPADRLEPGVPLHVFAHLLEIRGVDAVHLHRDGLLAGQRRVDVRLLSGRYRTAEGVDVPVLDEFVQRGEGGVVEYRRLDLELVCVGYSVAKVAELPVTLAGDAVGLGVGVVDLCPLVTGCCLVCVEQSVLAVHLRMLACPASKACVRDTGHPVTAPVMGLSVRSTPSLYRSSL
ncbi:MAG: hypothetical protein J07HX64_02927 [halophilic archaeon J07HX64]|nr:MAG: hypothetical protein J07HX64_02927 [halophilic archaeon J07HX64]